MSVHEEERRIVCPYYILSPGISSPEDATRIFSAREVVATVDGLLSDAIPVARENARKFKDDMSENELIRPVDVLELQQRHRLIKLGGHVFGHRWKTIGQIPPSES